MEVLSPDTQATLMLTARLGSSEVKPLTLSEYNKLARQLVERKMRPGDLLAGPFDNLPVAFDRLRNLLSRGTALAIAVERWAQAGVRVVGRSDSTYPVALRTKLRSKAAPVLYCSGKLELLVGEFLCIVGSRDASSSGLAFAARLGRACAEQNFGVVSGAARGIDQEAMQAAIDGGGRVVGVLAEALETMVLTRRNRNLILDGRLLLMSPFEPSARFTVAHAMERNRYLYALADAAVIVDSDVKGGTWTGALENQKYGWTPAFVRISEDAGVGNERLVANGLFPLLDRGDDFPRLRSFVKEGQYRKAILEGEAELPFDSRQASTEPDIATPSDDTVALFDFFLLRLQRMLADGEKSEATIAAQFGLEFDQARRWLERAEAARLLRRLDDTDRFVLYD